VQQFITFEKERERRQMLESLHQADEWTVFTVFFGVWDLLEYCKLEKKEAVHAKDRNVQELVHNLDVLADHVNGPIKVVLPRPVDVTFLPRYSSRKALQLRNLLETSTKLSFCGHIGVWPCFGL
jgi:hypothetical protein